MTTYRRGKRHPLLLYRRAFDPAWQTLLGLGLLILIVQQLSGRVLPFIGLTPHLPSPFDEIVFVSALLLLGAGLLLLLARPLAIVQAQPDHLRIATPFTTIKVSYRRVRSVHPANISQIFPPATLSSGKRAFLEPYWGKTAVIVELASYPLSPRGMRFFLGAQSLLPHSNGLVLLVPDWMALSTEIDSLYGNWRQGRAPGASGPGGKSLFQQLGK
jgi:hypothetical protein